MATINMDFTSVPQSDSFDPLPAGWYNAMMDQSEMKPTKSGTGMYLETRFNILDGQYVGRKVFFRFNLQNENPVAQEIGWKQLSSLAHSCGRVQVGDSQELHGLPVKIKVKLKVASGDYEASNEITAFKNINEVTAPAGAAPAAPAWAPQPAAAVAPAPAFAPQQPAAPQPWAAPAPAAPQQPAAQPAWAAAPAQPWAAPAAAPAAPAAPAAAPVAEAPHPAQSAPPPWMNAAAPAGPAGAPPWAGQAPQA